MRRLYFGLIGVSVLMTVALVWWTATPESRRFTNDEWQALVSYEEADRAAEEANLKAYLQCVEGNLGFRGCPVDRSAVGVDDPLIPGYDAIVTADEFSPDCRHAVNQHREATLATDIALGQLSDTLEGGVLHGIHGDWRAQARDEAREYGVAMNERENAWQALVSACRPADA
jgi:hypothetical protein